MTNSIKNKEFRLKTNKVSIDRAKIYLIFWLSIYREMNNTFIHEGDMTYEDYKGHFNWCFNKISSEIKSKLDFEDSREFLLNFFIETYYYSDIDKSQLSIDMVTTIHLNLNVGYVNNEETFENFIKIYKLFEKEWVY